MEFNSEKKKQDIHATDILQSANSTQELNDDEMKAVLHNLANTDPSQSQAIHSAKAHQNQPSVSLENNGIARSASADGTEPLQSAELADRLNGGTKRTHSASNILSFFKKQPAQHHQKQNPPQQQFSQQEQRPSDSTQPLSEEEQKNALAQAQVKY